MSLDVYLEGKPYETKCYCTDCGNEHAKTVSEEFYSANITHNLWAMADKAGIYDALWRPYKLHKDYDVTEGDSKSEYEFEANHIVCAKDISEVIEKGLNDMKSRPEYYKQFDASNGWGTYKDFIPWIEKYLNACKEYPDSIVRVSR